MWFFYVASIIPVAIGAWMWVYSRRVVWWEWLACCGVGLLTSLIFHAIAFYGMTHDTETWSGQIIQATHYPEWVEKETYTETITERGSDGKLHTRTETRTRYVTHPEYWSVDTSIPDSYNVPKSTFNLISQRFGGRIKTESTWKPGFYSGDPNIYVCRNETGYVFPTTSLKHFENRVKAAPTLFSFPPVPETAPVFEYPENRNFMQSDRLMGTARHFVDVRSFDLLNTRVGPTNKVNLILIGFGNDVDQKIAQYQQAKWIGGKKNDLVICFGGGGVNKPAQWCYVFGWTEKEIVKQNLQTLLITTPINTNLLPLIEREINRNYVIKDWSKFDYITIEPPTWSYIVFFITLAGSQVGFWFWAVNNDQEKL